MKIKAVIHCELDCDASQQHNYSVFSFDMTDCGYVKVQEVEIEFEPLTQKDATLASVEVLRKKQTALRAETERQLNQLEEHIQRLLCLEYKGDAA